MKNIFLLFLLILITASGKLTAQWVHTNSPYGGNIKSLAVSGTNIFAGTGGGVGGNGIFLTTNNGANWTAVNNGLPRQSNVYSLTASGTNVFAGLNSGGVYLSTNNGTNWTSINNGLPQYANVFALAVSGTNVFAGTVYSGGIFRSTDNGSNWTAVNKGLPEDTTNIEVEVLTVSDNNIFAGTTKDGIFRSTDNGDKWIYCGFKDTTVYSIVVSGTNIFAGTWNCGIFRSTDNGKSWTAVNNGLTGLSINALAACQDGMGGTNIFAGTGTGGVSLSTDNGSSWKQINTGLPTNYWILSLAVFPNGAGGSNIIVGNSRGVYISTNNGSYWTESNDGLTGINVNALALSNNSITGSNIFAGTTSGIFLSTDNGINWSTANNGLVSYSVIDVTALAVSEAKIYAGIISLNTGLFFSTNNGTDWQLTNPSGQVQSIKVSDKNIIAGTISTGVFLSNNNGSNWTKINNGLTNTDIFSVDISSNKSGETTLYAGTWGNGVFHSTNNGTSWDSANSGLPENAYVSSLAVRDTIVFTGLYNGIYRSTDKGLNWIQVNTGLSGNSVFVRTLLTYGNNIIAGTAGGIFLSTNNGVSWKEIDDGLSGYLDTRNVAVSTTDIFVYTDLGGIWKRPLSEIIPSLWQTDLIVKDNGNISQTLTFGRSPVASDSIDAQLNEASLPPAAFGFDVRFHLPAGDDSWKDFRPDTKDSTVWLIKFQPGTGGYPITFSWDSTKFHAGNIYLKDVITGTIVNVNMKTTGTYVLTNTGINELEILYTAIPTSIASNVEQALPSDYSLSQNYPNPFNPATVIRYGLPGNSKVKISVYNILGQFVESLVNGAQSAGYHEVTWNAAGKASGIYLYSIEAVSENGKNNFRSVKKLIFLK